MVTFLLSKAIEHKNKRKIKISTKYLFFMISCPQYNIELSLGTIIYCTPLSKQVQFRSILHYYTWLRKEALWNIHNPLFDVQETIDNIDKSLAYHHSS